MKPRVLILVVLLATAWQTSTSETAAYAGSTDLTQVTQIPAGVERLTPLAVVANASHPLYPNDSPDADLLIDGNLNYKTQCFYFSDQVEDQWLDFTFSELVTIEAVRIHASYAGQTSPISVWSREYRNPFQLIDWVTAPTFGFARLPFEYVPAQPWSNLTTLRLVLPGGSEPWPCWVEVEFFGATGPTTPPAVDWDNQELVVTGPEEVVFDWSRQRCEEWNVPDLPTRAFRRSDGQVQLHISNESTYRMIGPDLNHLTIDCSQPVHTSTHNGDPARHDDAEWLAGLYTEDGETIYALVHNEYHGYEHGLRMCPSGSLSLCWYNTITAAVSVDSGDTFAQIGKPPDHLVASLPIRYDPTNGPNGIRTPSNIIKGPDDYFYAYFSLATNNSAEQWVCAARTDDLSDPRSWRYWDGSGFSGQFVDPYRIRITDPDNHTCAPVDPDNIGASLHDSITYNTVLDRYVLIGIMGDATPTGWGIYYSLSDDMVNWTPRRLFYQPPVAQTVDNPDTDLFYAYPSLLDPDSLSVSFNTTDDTAYLYLTRLNGGKTRPNRDLVRVPVRFFPRSSDGYTRWEFNSNGDAQGWVAQNDMGPFVVSDGTLMTTSTGGDPYMVSPDISLAASHYPTVEIRMRITGGDNEGQLFFTNESDPFFDETKSKRFPVIGDGEFHTCTVDMSTVAGWEGYLNQIRLDPGGGSGFEIEIDWIAFVHQSDPGTVLDECL